MFPVNEEGCDEILNEVDTDTEDTATPCDNQSGDDLSTIPDVATPLPHKNRTPISTINNRKRNNSQVFVGHRNSPAHRQIFVQNLWNQEDKLLPLLGKFGEIESVRFNGRNGFHTGAVITFVRGDSAEKALRGRPIKTRQNHEFLVHQKPKMYDNALKIFIANIVPCMTHADLVEAFQKFGMVEQLYVIGGKSGAYGFAVFQYAEDASRAIEQKFVSISGNGYVTVKIPK